MPENNQPIVSIIITAHNYGKYLVECIESALNQNYNKSYEIIIINDGSTDNTRDILAKYEHNPQIKCFQLDGVGLPSAANYGVQKAHGKYIIRLDADDYFDENILLIEANILDNRPEIGMVYPDYYHVDQFGIVIEHIRLQKVNDEVKLLDRNPLDAGAMFRKEYFDLLGGYDETLRYQTDFDFWIRFIDKYNVYNVNLPLMYYRKHGKSMSTNVVQRAEARRKVKNNFAEKKGNRPNVLAIIPSIENDWGETSLALKILNGHPVIYYTISEAFKTKNIGRVIVSTDSKEIADLSNTLGAETPFLRPKSLSTDSVTGNDIIKHALECIMNSGDTLPDSVAMLQIISPLRKSYHIDEAVDTFSIFNPDSVISVVKDISNRWKPGEHGLEPIFYKKMLLKKDKESLYRENGAVYIYKTENILRNRGLGEKVGHIEMLPEESVRLFSDHDFFVAENILKKNITNIRQNKDFRTEYY